MTAKLDPLARLLVSTLAPQSLRASFEGDLLEEQALRLAANRPVRLWTWSQIGRSAPALLRQQLIEGSPQRRIALPMTGLSLATMALLLWIEDAHTLAPHVGVLFLVGMSVACFGLLFSTAGMRTLSLALGVGLALVGDFFAAGQITEQAFVIFMMPVFAYPSLDDSGRRCRRRDADDRPSSERASGA